MGLTHSNVYLTPEDKLDAIRHVDVGGTWESLDDWRYCTVCKKLFSGRQIEVLGGSRPLGPLRLHCPTAECNSTPADWHSSPARDYARDGDGAFNFPPDVADDAAFHASYRDDGR